MKIDEPDVETIIILIDKPRFLYFFLLNYFFVIITNIIVFSEVHIFFVVCLILYQK